MTARLPNEELLSDYDDVERILCDMPDRETQTARFEDHYRSRMNAVNERIVEELRTPQEGSGHISLSFCRRYRSPTARGQALARAQEAFVTELTRWEDHYGLPHGTSQ